MARHHLPVQSGYNVLSVVVCVQGLGTDEETLMEILCTRSKEQLQEISAAYKQCKSETCLAC